MHTTSDQSNHLPPVQVVEEDYERLSDFVCASPVETDALALLWSELLRASIVNPIRAPKDLVRMNSVVHYTDLRSHERKMARLIYPQAERLERGDVAVDSPLGAALIGLRPGATFSWTSETDGPHTIQIDKVEPLARSRPGRRPSARRDPVGAADASPACEVDEILKQTFPASDAPSWTLGRGQRL